MSLILLVNIGGGVVLLLSQVLFLQQLENGLGIGEVDDVVLVSALIPRNLLIWGISPVAVDSELVHVLLGLEEFDEDMCSRLHANLLSKAGTRVWLSWHNCFHLLTLPIVELTADFDELSSE